MLVCIGFEPADAEPKFVPPEGIWLFEILAKPSQHSFKIVGIRAGDVSSLYCQSCRLKYPLFNMAVFISAPDCKAHIFPSMKRVVPFQNEALIFSFYEGKVTWNAGKNSPHSSTDDFLQSLFEW